ncbi:MAG: HAD-IB family phosphatase [Gemmatimonadota bacterium]|nr:HAD-IB family phosphatase [Gemmatimonadota bacterium]
MAAAPGGGARLTPITHAIMRYGTVIFDCDSTLSALEGIEMLAADVRAEVAELTASAMAGEVPLEEVYARRLELIRPHRDDVQALVPRYVEGLVDDAEATVGALTSAGLAVRVISGGLLPAVTGLARHLGLDTDAVAAVPIAFDEAGTYAGFDDVGPARAGGKAEVIRAWKADGLPRPVMFVGDGATDLEAAGDVELFVAYAGVVERPEVVAAAPVVVRSRSLAPVVPLALGGKRPDDDRAAVVYDRGVQLIEQGTVEWR